MKAPITPIPASCRRPTNWRNLSAALNPLFTCASAAAESDSMPTKRYWQPLRAASRSIRASSSTAVDACPIHRLPAPTSDSNSPRA